MGMTRLCNAVKYLPLIMGVDAHRH